MSSLQQVNNMETWMETTITSNIATSLLSYQPSIKTQNFSIYYYLNKKPSLIASSDTTSTQWNENLYIYSHGNGICIIGLPYDHSLFYYSSYYIKSIRYVKNKIMMDATLKNHNSIQVTGKRKRDAINIESGNIMCEIDISNKFNDEDVSVVENRLKFSIPACVNGQILEVNTKLKINILVSEFQRQTEKENWLFIILTKSSAKLKNYLISDEEYLKQK